MIVRHTERADQLEKMLVDILVGVDKLRRSYGFTFILPEVEEWWAPKRIARERREKIESLKKSVGDYQREIERLEKLWSKEAAR